MIHFSYRSRTSSWDMKMFQEKSETMPMQIFWGKRSLLWDLCRWRIFLIKWDSRACHHEVSRKTGSLSKSVTGLCYQNRSYETSSLNLTSNEKDRWELILKTDCIKKHLTKKKFVRFSQFFELRKVKILPKLYFWDKMMAETKWTRLNRVDVRRVVQCLND